jgi:hypothetical protein
VVDLQDNQQERLENLESENTKLSFINKSRVALIEERIAENPELAPYVQVVTLANGEKSIRIDWDAIEEVEKAGKAKLGDQITEFYDTNKKDLDAIYEN